ncbi:MAG: sigma-B regulation protein RsbU (phosphoserine phosphatase), partial [Patescibacteria group bacterium]
NNEGTFFDEDYLMQFAEQNEFNSASLFNEKLMTEIKRFKGDQEFPDDITVLTCKIFSKK